MKISLSVYSLDCWLLFLSFMPADIAGLVVAEENRPLVEDLLLREFPPIAPALQSLQFEGTEQLSAIQEVARSATVSCVLF